MSSSPPSSDKAPNAQQSPMFSVFLKNYKSNNKNNLATDFQIFDGVYKFLILGPDNGGKQVFYSINKWDIKKNRPLS